MTKHYVIVSLKHSSKDAVAFWRSNDAGYTTNPWQAGIYSEEQVANDPGYYNDGSSSIAVCVNNSSLPDSGIGISIKSDTIKEYRRNNLGQISPSKSHA